MENIIQLELLAVDFKNVKASRNTLAIVSISVSH